MRLGAGLLVGVALTTVAGAAAVEPRGLLLPPLCVSPLSSCPQGGQELDSLGHPAPREPDPSLTPGDVLDVSVADICAPGYGRRVRDVPQAVKRQVYARYGVGARAPGEYEVDHLVSLGIGGSNSVRNLWPQANWTSPWNARVKDALEDRLHRNVCAGRVDLATAQHEMATDWVAAYQRYFHRPAPRNRSH